MESIDLIEQVADNSWKIYGEATLSDIHKETGIYFKREDCDTFNGLLIHTLEKVPKKGEVKELEIDEIKISEIEVSRHHVISAVVTK